MNTTPQNTVHSADDPWWRGAVIYQIYPRSFYDSNADGIGDLNGITKKLDYVASLGVDGVWLSPFFKSPMEDFGYDVSDYCDVDPIFGTLKDFDRLIEKAHGLNLKVIIDQVYSHTSNQHSWFKQSRADRSNPKADWYVWADPRDDGSPPNNWQSVFGGGAWEWDSRRKQYYLHNFLTSQPDLNVHNPDVQAALLDTARFWLDRGVDGFRLDALNFSMHDQALGDNPPAPKDGRPLTRPFDYQLHTKSMSHPDMPTFLEKIRAVTDGYEDIFTVAEIVGPTPLAEMKGYTADNNRLNSAYNFDFLYADKISSDFIKNSLSAWNENPSQGWPSWAFSNHDAPRVISRWADRSNYKNAAKLYLMLLCCLRGNIFIYQGEELGLPQADIPFDALQDPEAIANWPETLGRDGARTPIPWTDESPHSGFTQAVPWLPIDRAHLHHHVQGQENDDSSVLNFLKRMIEIRTSTHALRTGSLSFEEVASDILIFRRSQQGQEILCVFNLTQRAQKLDLPDNHRYRPLLQAFLNQTDGNIPDQLPALSGFIALKLHDTQ